MTDGSADYDLAAEHAAAYVDRASYAALEAHAALLADQLQAARVQRDEALRRCDGIARDSERLEQERDEARERLSEAFQQRTRLANLVDRAQAHAADALAHLEQEKARTAFALEQRDAARAAELTNLEHIDRLTAERDHARQQLEGERVAAATYMAERDQLAEQVTTPAVMVDGDLVAQRDELFAQQANDRVEIRELREIRDRVVAERDDARKAAREGDQHLKDLVALQARYNKAHSLLENIAERSTALVESTDAEHSADRNAAAGLL